MEVKKPWESKTNWVALILAIGSFVPGFEVIKNNGDVVGLIAGAAMFAMRFVTKKGVSLSISKKF